MLLAEQAIDLADWRARLERDGEPLDLDRFTAHVAAEHLPHRVMIDCTADARIAARYADWLRAGLHVVTPNKKANSAALAEFRRMHEARRAAGAQYFYEATVGAGLPIILTVRDLRETGRPDPRDRGHPVRHARLPVQRLRRQGSRSRRS